MAGLVFFQRTAERVTQCRFQLRVAKGKERLWLQIRQNNGKKWKVYESLANRSSAIRALD